LILGVLVVRLHGGAFFGNYFQSARCVFRYQVPQHAADRRLVAPVASDAQLAQRLLDFGTIELSWVCKQDLRMPCLVKLLPIVKQLFVKLLPGS
jgi:hypothetical protein